jgi:hypothetical protein
VYPGLYEAGFDRNTLARLFSPPRKNTLAGRRYNSQVNARTSVKKNNARKITPMTHFARSQQKLLKEWMLDNGQPIMSGDDMNIIQVSIEFLFFLFFILSSNLEIQFGE